MDSNKIQDRSGQVADVIWNELPPELRHALEISIEQSERGEVSPHKEVMARIKSRYAIT